MNIALSTIIIFLLLLPGFIYRRFYYTQEFSKQYLKNTFFEFILSCFGPSLIFHVIGYYFCLIIGYQINLETLGKLLMSKDYDYSAFINIKNSINNIILYQIVLNGFAGVIGYVSKWAVRALKLDRNSKIFRFQNNWYYIFSGEFFDFDTTKTNLIQDTVEDIELVYVDALVETKEGSIIYDGVYVDCELTKDNQLDFIVIEKAQRRFLRDDKLDVSDKERSKKLMHDVNEKGGNPYYTVPGHVMSIPYSTILNLNLSYYKLEIDESTREASLILVR